MSQVLTIGRSDGQHLEWGACRRRLDSVSERHGPPDSGCRDPTVHGRSRRPTRRYSRPRRRSAFRVFATSDCAGSYRMTQA